MHPHQSRVVIDLFSDVFQRTNDIARLAISRLVQYTKAAELALCRDTMRTIRFVHRAYRELRLDLLGLPVHFELSFYRTDVGFVRWSRASERAICDSWSTARNDPGHMRA